MYRTDGSSHNTGVKGENSLLIYFNNAKNFDFIKKSIVNVLPNKVINKPFNFIQRGGTRQRTDIFDTNNNISISIKSKKINSNKYAGTFDLINTSMIKELTGKQNSSFKKSLDKYYEELNKLIDEKINNYKTVKNRVDNRIKDLVKNITGEEIQMIFNKAYILEKHVIDVIRDYTYSIDERIESKSIHFLRKEWLKLEMEKIDTNFKVSTDKKSFAIINKHNSKSFFRLRISLNNGIKSLMMGLGLIPKEPNKNVSSCLTFKIQVDKVAELINEYDVNKKQE